MASTFVSCRSYINGMFFSGGGVLNIYQRVNAVMKDCEYLQKKQAQQGKGIKYDEVIAMLRELLIKHGIVLEVRQNTFESSSGVENTKQKIYQGYYEMYLVNMDAPNERIKHTAFAHGMDGGDKAPGKAHTYAVKMMLVKAFCIETGEDEESRAEKIDKRNTIDESQVMELAKYCVDRDGASWTMVGRKLLKAYKINQLDQLPASKFKEALSLCKS